MKLLNKKGKKKTMKGGIAALSMVVEYGVL